MAQSGAFNKGKKRGRDGKEKPPNRLTRQKQQGRPQTPPLDTPVMGQTSPDGQPRQRPRSTPLPGERHDNGRRQKKQKREGPRNFPLEQLPPGKAQPQRRREKRQKLPRLPDNVTVSKRPLHHPALPTPFTSSASPKTLYITCASPFIPATKRIRNLLSEISKRVEQSQTALYKNSTRKPLRASGRLAPKDVEKQMVEETRERRSTDGKGGSGGGEEVFVKATGRAIPRALQIGNYFQNEDDCSVRVEIGSVNAIDDIEVMADRGGPDGNDAAAKGGITNMEQVHGNSRARKGKVSKDEDIPETRIRTLSYVMVAISLMR